MLDRRQLAMALAGVALAPGLATAQEPPPESKQIIGADLDLYDRLTIPVTVGDRGGYNFVVDTGADRTVLSEAIADELQLPPGPEVLVQGVTGAEPVRTVRAPAISIGQITLDSVYLPVLPRDRLGVDGLLGVDALRNRRLVMNFRERLLEILPARAPSTGSSRVRDTYVPARDRFGRLVVIDAMANTAGISAFIDSGAGMTIGNEALARAVQARGSWRDLAPSVPIYGVTSQSSAGEVRVLESLRLGNLRFTGVPMIVADLDLFAHWGMADTPTLLVGVNVLRLFSRVEMDYSRRRMMFRVGADPQIWMA